MLEATPSTIATSGMAFWSDRLASAGRSVRRRFAAWGQVWRHPDRDVEASAERPPAARRLSVAMTEAVNDELVSHLLRADGQEDICLATYTVSTGHERTTVLIHTVELPGDGDRAVHGNATIYGRFVLRVASAAAQRGHGVVLLHSHPEGRRWQAMSAYDADTERSYAPLAEQMTSLPLVGMTLAGASGAWSARSWNRPNGRDYVATELDSVRVVGGNLTVTFNDARVPAPTTAPSQMRTTTAWGAATQADIARLRILVVGVGSVGLDIAVRMAATGVEHLGVMDTDVVEEINLDRMIGATRDDAQHRRMKVDVAARLARSAATSPTFDVETHHVSICTPEGLAAALNYDVIICCVDRPWPRAVMNTLAYADLIPVIDGGIAIDTFANGSMRGATRRVQTATPSRPCLFCSGQVSPIEVRLEMEGDLDNPAYIRAAGREPVSGRPNVAALCAGVSASQLEHFVALVAKPAGFGVPGPQRFSLATGWLEHLDVTTRAFCDTELNIAAGDGRTDLTRPATDGAHPIHRR